MPYGDAQDGWVMVESFDKMWSTGEENVKPLQYSCLENLMNSTAQTGPHLSCECIPWKQVGKAPANDIMGPQFAFQGAS